MSASQSENAARSAGFKGGEFGSRVEPTGPQESGGHKPGVLATKEDNAPEGEVKVLPPGSAPASKTYTPNPDSDETPSQADNPAMSSEAETSAQDTISGATSGDVHQGLGHPGAGQSSAELRDNSKAAGGLQSVGASGAASHSQFNSERIDPTTSVSGATQKYGSEEKSRDEDYRMHDDRT